MSETASKSGPKQAAARRNVLNTALEICGQTPVTGFFRDGYCRSCAQDAGSHTVCAVVTREFLDFSARRGNDLVTPMPEFDFPGLKPGDRWCLCAARWLEAFEAGCAPPVVLEATSIDCLEIVTLQQITGCGLQ